MEGLFNKGIDRHGLQTQRWEQKWARATRTDDNEAISQYRKKETKGNGSSKKIRGEKEGRRDVILYF